MKIGIWLNSEYRPSTGGGYSYQQKFIEEIDQYCFRPELNVVFLQRSSKNPAKTNKELLIFPPLKWYVQGLYWYTIRFFKLTRLYRLAKYFQNKLTKINNDADILFLKRNKIDIVYYLSQMQQDILNFPSVITNWDIGHLSTGVFPEFILNGKFEYRENWYQNALRKAIKVIVESEAGKEELVRFTGISKERVAVVPIFAGGVTKIRVSENEQKKIVNRFMLEKNKFILYPAQFWPHKNHFNLIRAFNKLRNKFPYLKLVFSGSDKGNWDYLRQEIQDLGLTACILNLGFVTDVELHTLYKSALALIMPTFLGPTNMPLLEARALSCPVICSDMKGHREVLGDGAFYFDPLQPDEIVHCVELIMDGDKREDLLEKADYLESSSNFNSTIAIRELEKSLISVLSLRRCWGSFDAIS